MIYTIQFQLCKNMHAYWQVLVSYMQKLKQLCMCVHAKFFFPFYKLFFNIVLKQSSQ